jgi:hypothetical protein
MKRKILVSRLLDQMKPNPTQAQDMVPEKKNRRSNWKKKK